MSDLSKQSGNGDGLTITQDRPGPWGSLTLTDHGPLVAELRAGGNPARTDSGPGALVSSTPVPDDGRVTVEFPRDLAECYVSIVAGSGDPLVYFDPAAPMRYGDTITLSLADFVVAAA